MDQTLARLLVEKKYWAILFSLLLLTLAAIGNQSLTFDQDVKASYSSDNPQRILFEELETTYGRVDSIFIAMEAAQGDIFQPDYLQALEKITNEAWQTPHATQVQSLANHLHTRAIDDELLVAPLIEDIASQTQNQRDTIKTVALNDVSLVNRLVTPDGRVAGINIFLHFPKDRREAEEASATFAKQLEKKFEANYPGLNIYLTGSTMSNSAGLELVSKDMSTTLPLMYLLMFGCLGYLLRSITAVLGTFAVSMMATTAAFGCAGWMGIVLNSFSVSAMNVIITISVAHCVHILSIFFYEFYQTPNKQDGMMESLQVNMKPILITSFTTIIGFLSMNFSDMQSHRDMGNIVACGVVFALILSVAFLPQLLLVVPLKRRQKGILNISGAMERLANFVISRQASLFTVGLVVAFGLASLAPSNEVNERYMDYIKDHQFVGDNQFVDEHFGAIYTIEYSIGSGKENGISNPEYLQNLAEFTDWLRAQPEISNVYSYTDIIKQLNRTMHNEDPAYYRVPESSELAAQYLLLYEMSMPYGQDLGRMINTNKSASHLIVTFPSTSSKGVYALQQKIDDWMYENLPKEMQHPGSSYVVMASHIASQAMSKSITGGLVALLFITATLIVALKSFKFGLISIIPNMLPAAIGFGFWALYSGELGINLVGVLGITLGIVVDDTVHFLTKYIRAKREQGKSDKDAVRYAFATVGPALWTTTLMLVIGFGTLAFSQFKANADIGLMTALIIGVALLLDLFLLPPLLLMLAGRPVNGIPKVPHYIPWLGSGISFSTDADNFIRRCQKKFGDAFTLRMGGKTIHLILSPHDFPVFYKGAPGLEYDPIQKDVLESSFGVKKEVAQFPAIEMHNTLYKDLRGDALNPLVHRMQEELEKILDKEKPDIWQQGELQDYVRRLVFHASTFTLFGAGTSNDDRFEGFKKVDDNFPMLLGGIPAWMIKGIQQARILTSQRLGEERPDEAPVVKSFKRFWESMNMDAKNTELLHGVLIWGAQANTTMTAFWSAYYVFRDPAIRQRVKTEVRNVLNNITQRSPSGSPLLSVEALEQMVFLDSCIWEAMRFSNSVMSMRVATQDSELELTDGRNIHIEEGEFVAMYSRASHFDPDIYENPTEFIADRFIDKKKAFYKNGEKIKDQVTIFGGGKTICPGRMFAINEIKMTIALLVLKLDVDVQTSADIAVDYSRSGAGTLFPDQPVPMRFKRRTSKPQRKNKTTEVPAISETAS